MIKNVEMLEFSTCPFLSIVGYSEGEPVESPCVGRRCMMWRIVDDESGFCGLSRRFDDKQTPYEERYGT